MRNKELSCTVQHLAWFCICVCAVLGTMERSKERLEHKSDPLALALGIKVIDCREPLIPRHEFINDSVNDTLEMDQDFTYYKTQQEKVSVEI